MNKIEQTILVKKWLFYVTFFCSITASTAQEIASLYKQVNKSVVTIVTEFKTLNDNHQLISDESIGSGVMISNKGEILTAAHVVNNAETITVKFLDGEEILAKVIKSAPVADIALLKLSWMPKTYEIAKIGDSDNVSVGEQIVVLGAPYGIEHSLSVGYISGKRKQEARTSGFVLNEYFQTDASINKGNSGGPMFNLQGEVIGISSYIITESGGFQGLGFAATSNLAKKLVIDGNRRWTGINGFILDEKLAWMLNVPINGGILVESVVRFSPADFAGVKGGFENIDIEGERLIAGGDIILSVNGFPLTKASFENLDSDRLNKSNFFNQNIFVLKIWRGGKVEEVKIKFKD
ncbi:trypsin-like peptidase domain-containing protein [Mariniflexile litorale]|uniref:Trypsin-like peptidase domain-containing protein n=1 Tax=Mariniflexile litorale TaxID=3045158 RepID=A0AAU7EE24_9FLAO|nr:trypsin-like peptidase domain-containing protein [Mariniflexile sp. KMM 9835]MDQ8212270.1 trypsin-like peptidase domain-containing protein [Mariniflexile sp. KMM 9835]